MRPRAVAPLPGLVLLLGPRASAALSLVPEEIQDGSGKDARADSVHNEHAFVKPVDETVRSCVISYAGGLDSVRPNLGDGMRNHPMTGRPVERSIVLAPGMGTTGTKSLYHLLRNVLGFRATHYIRPHGDPRVANWAFEFQHRLGINDSDGKNCSVETCRSSLRKTNFAAVPKDFDVFIDTPVPQLFLDFWLAFPSAKIILQTRPADDWAASRLQDHPDSPAPAQEPCCLKTHNLTRSELSQLYKLHNDLVRCLVPKEQLFEFDFWTDSMHSLKKLPHRISAFLESGAGRWLPAPAPARASTPFVANEQGGDSCTGHTEILFPGDWGERAAMSARRGCDLDLRRQ